jgi:uncharacterized protein YukE
MTQPIIVNQGNLDGELEQLRAQVADMDGVLNDFETFAATHLSDWTGAAQAQYAQAKKNWDSIMLELRAMLAKTPVVMGDVANHHLVADLNSSRYFG